MTTTSASHNASDKGAAGNGDVVARRVAVSAAGDGAACADGGAADGADSGSAPAGALADAPALWQLAPAAGEGPLTADEALDRFLSWVEARGIELWPHQEEALMDLMVGNHVILGTPTGSGKSMVALGLLFMALCSGKCAYYTAPIKALVSEKFFDMVELLGRENVGMITGDTQINTSAPVICCTEEILANDALRMGAWSDIAAAAVDEFHFYGDPDRGWAWQVPLLALPDTQFLLMSATLGDTSAIARNLEERTGRDVDLVADAPRPVPLAYEYVKTNLEGTVELALRRGEAPLYIVHFSQDAALASAQALASFGVSDKSAREKIKDACAGTRFTTTFGKTLKRLLLAGVGVHHAGMLPRYRLLVEKLAQQGLLPVICGTDTLGVGINVPIHTVVLTSLAKYDGHRMRRLRSREFHQIAGRAGRSGFDTEGVVIAQAPEWDIENEKARLKAGDDPKKLRKIKRKKPPEGAVAWSEQTFTRLCEAPPEPLVPHLKVTHSMVLAEVEQGGDAEARVHELVDASLQSDEQKAALHTRADEVFATLKAAGVIELYEDEDGNPDWDTTVEVPDNFALDQPLSPFLLAALELLDPLSETYAEDAISMVEATLEDPRQVLRAQEREARARAMAEMKADGVEYEERVEKVQDVTYPKPLEDLLDMAFARYCEDVPWASDYCLRPKSVLRDMVETASDFKSYVGRYKIARSEGTLLRYLSDAYRVLDRTVPPDKYDERLEDIVAWLGLVVRSVDSSLVDEWERAGMDDPGAAPAASGEETVVRDRRGLTVLVRNALIRRVSLASRDRAEELGELDLDFGFGAARWRRALDAYYEEHEEIVLDADARSMAYLAIDETDERDGRVWRVLQTFKDENGDRDFGIAADVDLDATQEGDGVVFANYRVGFFEEIRE